MRCLKILKNTFGEISQYGYKIKYFTSTGLLIYYIKNTFPGIWFFLFFTNNHIWQHASFPQCFPYDASLMSLLLNEINSKSWLLGWGGGRNCWLVHMHKDLGSNSRGAKSGEIKFVNSHLKLSYAQTYCIQFVLKSKKWISQNYTCHNDSSC